jgi:long-chain acyl-CoA synthetase
LASGEELTVGWGVTTFFTDHIASADLDSPAVEDDHERIDYSTLIDRSERVAAFVQEAYGRSNYILLGATSTVGFIELLLGVVFSGNVPIPIDPHCPQRVLGKYRAVSGAIGPIRAEDVRIESMHTRMRNVDGALPAMVIFTSGTSGNPKGVMLSHGNVNHSCIEIAKYLNYYQHRSAAVALPLYYSYGLLSQVVSQLMIGGFVRLFSSFKDVLHFEKIVNSHSLASFCGVPTTFSLISRVNKLQNLHMPTVKVICSAGAAFNKSVYPSMKQVFSNCTFFNNYGMTEACPRISYVSDESNSFFDGSCGQLLSGMTAKVICPETERVLEDGESGMLCVKGPNVTSGYLNEPDRTHQAFTADGFLKTGDIGYFKGEELYIVGRKDDIFNVGGQKVSPIEVEHALNAVPGVKLSAVVGVEDEQRGKVPAAFLVLEEPVSRQNLMEEMRSTVSAHAVPVSFYEVSNLPMTANGKIQRRLLDPNSDYVVRPIL